MNHFLKKQENAFISCKRFYVLHVLVFFLCMFTASITIAHAQETFEQENLVAQNSPNSFIIASSDTKAVFDSFMETGAVLGKVEAESSENPPKSVSIATKNTVEENVLAFLLENQATIEHIDYNEQSHCLTLKGLSYSVDIKGDDSLEGMVGTVFASSLVLQGFNASILNPSTNNFLLSEDILVEDIKYTIHMQDLKLADISLKSFHSKEYKLNLLEYIENYKKNPLSDEFIKNLFMTAHKGTLLKNLTVDINPILTSQKAISMKIGEIFLDAFNLLDLDKHVDGQNSNLYYKNIEVFTPDADLKIGNLKFADIFIPNIDRILDFSKEVSTLQNTSKSEQEHFLKKTLEEYLKGDKPLFSQFLLENIVFIPKVSPAPSAVLNEIRLDRFALDFGVGKNIAIGVLMDGFQLTPEFLCAYTGRQYLPFLNALVDTLNFGFSSKQSIDTENHEMKMEFSGKINNVSEQSFELVVALDEKLGLLEQIQDVFDNFQNTKYKKVKLSYEDMGLLSFIGQVASLTAGAPLEALVPLVQAELNKFSLQCDAALAILKVEKEKISAGTSAKTLVSVEQQETLLVAVKELMSATLQMIEKPGLLEVGISFEEPVSADQIKDQFNNLENPSADSIKMEYFIKAQQGSKPLF